MQTCSTSIAIVVCVWLSWVAGAAAELPMEKRDAATHVLTGEVIAVYQRDMGPICFDYVVALRVSKVHKGDGIKEGEVVYASCFKRKKLIDPPPSAAGHLLIPQEKQVIQVYLKREGGRNVGIYPDWADLVKK
jgi:hypothetical protein